MDEPDSHVIDVNPQRVAAFLSRATGNVRTCLASFYGPGMHDWPDYMTAAEHAEWLDTYRPSMDWNVTRTISPDGSIGHQFVRKNYDMNPPRRDYVN